MPPRLRIRNAMMEMSTRLYVAQRAAGWCKAGHDDAEIPSGAATRNGYFDRV